MASICNDERAAFGVMSGQDRKLMRKRTAARSFLIPLGGRATYVVGLGALSSAEVKAAMAKQENAIAPMTPDASLQLFRTEQERYAKLD